MFTSCEFIPKGDSFTKVSSEIPPPDIVLDLSFDTDTLIITHYPFNIYYTAEAGDNLVYGIFLLIENDTLQTDFDNHGNFSFKPETFYEEGVHNLEMHVYTNSNTGSLADETGYEYFKFEYYWTLIIENAY